MNLLSLVFPTTKTRITKIGERPSSKQKHDLQQESSNQTKILTQKPEYGEKLRHKHNSDPEKLT